MARSLNLMNANCIFAGNVFFSKDLNTLTRISNKSGDFHPSKDSLIFALAILVLNESKLPFKLADHIEIEIQHSSGYLEHLYYLKREPLIEWVMATFSNTSCYAALCSQNEKSQKVFITDLINWSICDVAPPPTVEILNVEPVAVPFFAE